MITEAVSNWFLSLVATVIGWFPEMPAAGADALDSFELHIGQVIVFIARLDPLVPFDQLTLALGVVFVFWIVTVLLQGVRIVASFATLGGGSV